MAFCEAGVIHPRVRKKFSDLTVLADSFQLVWVCSEMTSDVSRGYHFLIFFPAFATIVRNASGRAERGQAVRQAVTIRQGWLGGRTEGRKIGEMMRGLVLLYHIRYLTTYPLTYLLSYIRDIYCYNIVYLISKTNTSHTNGHLIQCNHLNMPVL